MAMSNNIQAKIANVNNVMKPSGPVTSIVDLDTNSKNKMIEVKVYQDIECEDSYDSNLDESTFQVTPLSDCNEDEFFSHPR
ncbi:hypothetical protein Tco_1256395 [Tanacetum coccineum]